MNRNLLHLGTSGWSYKDWVGPFYADGSAPKDFLEIYSQHFHTVEIDSTFYGTPRQEYVRRWRATTPDDFQFSAKFPKEITHEKSLVDGEKEVTEFLKTMELLGNKLSVLLLQFEYGFKPDQFENLSAFLPTLPDCFRYALEIRNKKWLGRNFFELLRDNGVAFTLVDHPWMPRLEDVTSDFTYIRWLGDRRTVPENFSEVKIDRSKEVEWWAEVINKFLIDDVTTFGYVNNHFAGHSPATVRQIEAELDRIAFPKEKADGL